MSNRNVPLAGSHGWYHAEDNWVADHQIASDLDLVHEQQRGTMYRWREGAWKTRSSAGIFVGAGVIWLGHLSQDRLQWLLGMVDSFDDDVQPLVTKAIHEALVDPTTHTPQSLGRRTPTVFEGVTAFGGDMELGDGEFNTTTTSPGAFTFTGGATFTHHTPINLRDGATEPAPIRDPDQFRALRENAHRWLNTPYTQQYPELDADLWHPVTPNTEWRATHEPNLDGTNIMVVATDTRVPMENILVDFNRTLTAPIIDPRPIGTNRLETVVDVADIIADMPQPVRARPPITVDFALAPDGTVIPVHTQITMNDETI